MRIFLDENFPLGLERRLKNDGYEAEHVITIGWRGASDARIRERLVDADLLFLTQDEDFLFSNPSTARASYALWQRRFGGSGTIVGTRRRGPGRAL